VGARITIPGFGMVAMVSRGQTTLDLQLSAHLTGNVSDSGIEVPLTYDLATRTADAFLPQQVVLGGSFQRVPRLKVNFDLVFVNWAAYESPTALTTAALNPKPGMVMRAPTWG
jgi:long-chain fatty acid transport protein